MVKRKFIGVTGAPATGKSYLCDLIVKICNDHYIEAHNIDYDKLAHQIYEGDNHISVCVKKDLRKHFPGVVQEHRLPVSQGIRMLSVKPVKGRLSHESVDRKLLGDIVFARPDKLEILNKIMAEPIKQQFIKSIRNKGGLILINSALIAEHEMYYIYGGLSVGHIKCEKFIVTRVDYDTQWNRLRLRGLSDTKIEQLLSAQLSSNEKYTKIFYDGHDAMCYSAQPKEKEISHMAFMLREKIFKSSELI